jgi:hypothetical protein
MADYPLTAITNGMVRLYQSGLGVTVRIRSADRDPPDGYRRERDMLIRK